MDFNRHLDYIHFNPVKHGLVNDPKLYQYSSIHKFADIYQSDWGVIEKPDIKGEFGE
jgi:putative transposase